LKKSIILLVLCDLYGRIDCSWVENSSCGSECDPGESRPCVRDLYLAALFPMTGKSWRGGQAALTGGQLAVDMVNNRTDILPGYRLNLAWRNSNVSKLYPQCFKTVSHYKVYIMVSLFQDHNLMNCNISVLYMQ